jgi:predicted DNA-binding protein
MALIFLTDEQNDRLDQLAHITGKSRAELEQELSSAIDN